MVDDDTSLNCRSQPVSEACMWEHLVDEPIPCLSGFAIGNPVLIRHAPRIKKAGDRFVELRGARTLTHVSRMLFLMPRGNRCCVSPSLKFSHAIRT